jgi:N-acetylmuramoyl-L-alanine amidase
MPALTSDPMPGTRIGAAGAALALIATLGGIAGTPMAAAATPRPSTASGLTAASGLTTASGSPVHAANAGGAVVVAAAAPKGSGYWVAETDGLVTPEGGAPSYGDPHGANLAAPVVGMTTTGAGHGYYLVGADGGVFNYGDGGYFGSTGNVRLNQPVLGMAADPVAGGYWLVARDGGVFNFGAAKFYGSTGNVHLRQPVIGMSPAASGGGYWLVARDGGVFNFGAAKFYGSTGNARLSAPIVGMAADPVAGGYWLVARDGGVFNFGGARFFGSAATGRLPAPALGIVPTADGGGYWVVLGNGTVARFGDAKVVSAAGLATSGYSLVGQIVGIDPGHNGGNGSDPSYINQLVWNGREYETCDTTGTETDAGYTEAAYNFDVATRLQQVLRADGAEIVMTRTNNTGVGPCVNTRARILNQPPSDVAIDIHADGGPAGGRGTTVLEPVADGPNDAVIQSSDQLAVMIRDYFEQTTGEPNSDYDGTNGLQPRSDLAGLNLTTVSKVLIETANMRNATDAALVTSPTWRQEAAQGLANGLSHFLIGYP